MKHFGENITLLRKKKGFTQEALAGLIGVSAQSVSKWENSTNMPDISLLPVLADIFQCSIDALFGRESEGQGWSPEEAFDRGCEGLLQVLAAVGYNPGQEESIAERLERYRKELREEENIALTHLHCSNIWRLSSSISPTQIIVPSCFKPIV